MPSRGGVYFWLSDTSDNRTAEFANWQATMAIARTAHAYALADDCVDIADDISNDTIIREARDGAEREMANTEWIARSKLRVDTRLKLVEKLAPEQFGNALALTGANGGAIVIEQSPKEAARRIAFALALGARAANEVEGDVS